jgi:RNA polymerase sigma-70 factor (ECF subfamily)
MNLFAELENLRPALLRFAFLQLRQQSAAEDAVQETLLAVLENRMRFRAIPACAPMSPAS